MKIINKILNWLIQWLISIKWLKIAPVTFCSGKYELNISKVNGGFEIYVLEKKKGCYSETAWRVEDGSIKAGV